MKLPLAAPVASIVLGSIAAAQVTQRVSVSSSGAQANGPSANAAISADGTLVVFQSAASDLVSGDTNGFRDVFVRDRILGTTVRVSINPTGWQSNRDSDFPDISADGRYVVFRSTATNLGPTEGNGAAPDIFVHDRVSGSMTSASVSTAGIPANQSCHAPAISADGRYVAFSGLATNLVGGDTNGKSDVFVRDRQLGMTVRASVDSQGVQANGDSHNPAISADGRYVGFTSTATNLHPLGGGTISAFVRDMVGATTICASLDLNGFPAGGTGLTFSPEGRYVGYVSGFANLVPGDTNNQSDVFVFDLQGGSLIRVIANSIGSRPNAEFRPSLSLNARFIAFDSPAADLVAGDSNGAYDVFVHDRLNGLTMRVSLSTAGAEGSGDSFQARLTPDGNVLVFLSDDATLDPNDTNGARDAYLRDRGTKSFQNLCEPGVGGVIACPCGNPPGGVSRGCDNSASTGGGTLLGSGVAYLSSDNVVLRATGVRPTTLSILMQGNGAIAGGVTYGQGVRCVGGTIIRRLFVKNASTGSLTVPDFAAGDPTISARSAAKGDVIQPGQDRWYLAYYRDPVVPAGCPSTSNFNATQTTQVTWIP